MDTTKSIATSFPATVTGKYLASFFKTVKEESEEEEKVEEKEVKKEKKEPIYQRLFYRVRGSDGSTMHHRPYWTYLSEIVDNVTLVLIGQGLVKTLLFKRYLICY